MSTISRLTTMLLLACASIAHATPQQICIKNVEPGSDWYLQYTVEPNARVKVEWFFEPTLANMGVQGRDLADPGKQGIFTYALDQLVGTVFAGKFILINTVIGNRKVILYDPLSPQTTQTPIQFDWEVFDSNCHI